MADTANPAALPPPAPARAMPTAVPGHRTLPQPLPDLGPPGPPPPEPGEENDPWRFGCRFVRHEQPDGEETYEEVPLSWDDLLYPEEEDFVVQEPAHTEDFSYLHTTLLDVCGARPGVVVLGDCRVDWGPASGVRPLGPDLLVLNEVHHWLRQGTFRIAEEGGRPVLVIEVASPSTRPHDLLNKPDLYFRAGVEKYVIVDRGRRSKDPPRLLAYRRGRQGWEPLPLDPQGRVDLAPLGLLLGLEGNRAVLYDARTGARADAAARLQDAAAKLQDAAARAQDAAARAQDDSKARAQAEAKVRKETSGRVQAVAKIRKEAKARARAETKARKEATARAQAEAKARDEAKTRAALEERVSELEQQLRSRPATE